MLSSFARKRVLLLQGPMGLFFSRLRRDLEAAGAEVLKVNFCAGDWLFYPSKSINFRGKLEDWPTFLSALLAEHKIDVVFLFGDCRHYHIVVPHVLRWRRVQLYVFEEGYLRPDFITLDRGGANNFSSVPRDPDFYRSRPIHPISRQKVEPVKGAFSRAAVYASCYAIANFLFKPLFPHYRHHRPLNPFQEAFFWLRSGWRKQVYRHRQRALGETLKGPLSGRFFLVPLQTHNDSQIRVHSRFSSIEEFVEFVVCSFANHADPCHWLVFKHHPLDRGYRDYHAFLRRMIRKYGVDGRVVYVHDVHLPNLLRHAIGTIVVNSTVGLSSILHETPVCVLGDPIYHFAGLTYQGRLDDFWREPGAVDHELFLGFRAWLMAHNQANGNFYRRLPVFKNHTGVAWPPILEPEEMPVSLPAMDRPAQALQSKSKGLVKCAT